MLHCYTLYAGGAGERGQSDMTETPVSVLKEAAELGLRLEAQPDGLHVNPGDQCSPAFEETLRAHKPHLLALLRLPFVMVFSETLQQDVFFCHDEQTKAALIEAGADEWSIYTRGELRILCEAKRVAPLSDAELRKVHEIKRTFNGSLKDS
jgi:hypothetical protein